MLLIVACTNASAQSQHVYEDSAALYPEQSGSYDEKVEVVEAPAEITDSNTPVRAEEVDTDLVNNRHFLSPDSLIALQNEKQLLYAKDLDSLLRKFQKQQQAKADKAARKSEDGSNIPIGVTPLESFFNSSSTQYFLWGLAALFVLFILYKLFFTAGIFRLSATKNLVQITDEEEAKPIAGKDFDAAIAKAKNETNYRLAVRYLYLQLLQRLAATGAIEFSVDKTNTEYLRELSGKPYKDEVAALTMYYEYAWYGEFAIDENMYLKIERRYRNVVV